MRYLLGGLWLSLSLACTPSLPTPEAIDLRFATTPSPLPAELVFREIGFAQELINIRDLSVVISGGDQPLPRAEWDRFKPRLPWTKNLDRHLLFEATALLRSPSAPADCAGEACLSLITYQGYTWIELARPRSVSFIPAGEETDMLKPDPGHLVVKTIEKCQAVRFSGHIYRLSDGQGNLYAMHASEAPEPSLDVTLPPGWMLERVELTEPLIIPPFGGEGHCYHNILGDHLGQGYHQYQFAGAVWPDA